VDTNGKNIDLLREFLAEADVPCPGCGYNLRGLRAGACPECNEALQLQVGLVEPRVLPYVAAAAGLSAGAGAAGLWLVAVVILSLYLNDWPPAPWIVIPAAATVIEGGLLALLIRRRGRTWFRTLSPRQRSGAIVAAWLATLVWPVVGMVSVILRQ